MSYKINIWLEIESCSRLEMILIVTMLVRKNSLCLLRSVFFLPFFEGPQFRLSVYCCRVPCYEANHIFSLLLWCFFVERLFFKAFINPYLDLHFLARI